MKKKFFSLLLVFAFAFTGVVCLTACGGKVQFSELVIEVNNTEYQTSYNFGNFECNTTPNLNYKVYAKYTDGSKKEFNNNEYNIKYKINGQEIESLPETYDGTKVGEYNISLTYEHFTFDIYYSIVYATKTYQMAPLSKTVWSYGQEQPELSLVDTTIELNQDSYRFIKKSDVENPNSLTADELCKAGFYSKDIYLEPGEYYLFIMVPQTGIYAETPSVLRPVKVNKMQLVATHSESLKVTYDYANVLSDGNYRNGNFQIKDININGLFEVQSKDGERVDIVRYALANPDTELNSTNNGDELTCNFTFWEGYEYQEKYYILPESAVVTLEVIKGQFEKPTILAERGENDQKGKIDIYVGEKSYITSCDEWKALNLNISKPNGSTENVNIDSEENTHILLDWQNKAGTYTYTLSLKDKENYTWSDNSSEDVSEEIIVFGDDITGKTLVFENIRLLDSNGSIITDEENEYFAMIGVLREANLGLIDSETGEPVDPSIAVPATLKAESNGTVSGTCDFGSGTYNKLIAEGNPFYYFYDSSREDTVMVFAKESDVVKFDSLIVGNLVGDTLTLTSIIYNYDESGNPTSDTGLRWEFTFKFIESA